jgi:hypothetical protein
MGRSTGQDVLSNGGITVEKSATGIHKLVEGLTKENSAHFYQYDGAELPW